MEEFINSACLFHFLGDSNRDQYEMLDKGLNQKMIQPILVSNVKSDLSPTYQNSPSSMTSGLIFSRLALSIAFQCGELK